MSLGQEKSALLTSCAALSHQSKCSNTFQKKLTFSHPCFFFKTLSSLCPFTDQGMFFVVLALGQGYLGDIASCSIHYVRGRANDFLFGMICQ